MASHAPQWLFCLRAACSMSLPLAHVPSYGRHALRVVAVPPVVKCPASHAEHDAAPATLYLLFSPHGWHTFCPPGEKYPASHIVWVLVPSHLYPGGQDVHVVRVISLPPEVYEPTRHVSHCLASCCECFASLPHSWHWDSPPPEKYPGKQRVRLAVPSQE